MAIATLCEVYNNPNVFCGVVKIRKGLACRMILESRDLEGINAWFRKLVAGLARRIPATDPSASRTHAACNKAMDVTKPTYRKGSGMQLALLAAVPVVASVVYFYGRRYEHSFVLFCCVLLCL